MCRYVQWCDDPTKPYKAYTTAGHAVQKLILLIKYKEAISFFAS